MVITKKYLTKNKFSRPGIKLNTVTKIAVHYTGLAKSTAIATRTYFENLKDQIPDPTGKYCVDSKGNFVLYKGNKVGIRYVSSHFVVGLEGEIIQCIPLTEMSYCTNQANPYSISIEVCHPDNTGKFTEATEKSLTELVAYLLKEFKLGTDDIIRHYDVTGKQCPLYWAPTKYQPAEIANARFAEFKKGVATLIGEKKNPATTNKTPSKNSTVITETMTVPFQVKVIDDALNIRNSASLKARINGVITDHGVYTITALKKNGAVLWGRLKSAAGWISMGSAYVRKYK